MNTHCLRLPCFKSDRAWPSARCGDRKAPRSCATLLRVQSWPFSIGSYLGSSAPGREKRDKSLFLRFGTTPRTTRDAKNPGFTPGFTYGPEKAKGSAVPARTSNAPKPFAGYLFEVAPWAHHCPSRADPEHPLVYEGERAEPRPTRSDWFPDRRPRFAFSGAAWAILSSYAKSPAWFPRIWHGPGCAPPARLGPPYRGAATNTFSPGRGL